LRNRLKRKGVNEKDIAEFCIHSAKRLERPILDKLSGEAADMVLSYHPIEEFFPSLSDELIDDLLTVVGEARNGLLETCERSLLTGSEAYQQLGHSASLFKAILGYVREEVALQ
jgi:hypothetical protein